MRSASEQWDRLRDWTWGLDYPHWRDRLRRRVLDSPYPQVPLGGSVAVAGFLLGKVSRVETWVRRSMRMGGGTEGSSVSLLWVRRVTMLWTACRLTRRRHRRGHRPWVRVAGRGYVRWVRLVCERVAGRP